MVADTVLPPSNEEGGSKRRKEPGPVFPNPVHAGGPKRLVFPESPPKQVREHMPKPVFPKEGAGPKPLGFKTPPVKSPTPSNGSAPSIGRPVFPNEPKRPPPQNTTKQAKPASPKPLFERNDDQNLVNAAVKYVEDNFAALANRHDRIERQIRQLSPLTMEVLANWGGRAISEGGDITSSAARLVKSFADLQGNELVEAALNAAKGPVAPSGWMDMIRSFAAPKPESVLSFKPRLIVLKAHLVPLIPQIDSHIHETKESELRLLLNMASLVAVCEVMGRPSDATMDRLMYDRRTILSQASNQSQLVNLQLVQTKQTITQLMSKIDQLLTITIPAFEMAHATR